MIPIRVNVDWEGPFSLATSESRKRFLPPSSPGVYIWAVGAESDPRIAYVGEASNLHNRLYSHVHCTLGGAYWLYETNDLLIPNSLACYKGGGNNLFTHFLNEYERFSRLAFENLTHYLFFWAKLPEIEKQIRQAIESVIIKSAQEHGHPVQNQNVSRKRSPTGPLQIDSSFQDRTILPFINCLLDYD